MASLAHRVAAGVLIGMFGVTTMPGEAVAQETRGDEQAARVFAERTGAYAALHRKLEGPLPARQTLRAHELAVERAYLATAIKGQRRNARQGDIFTPAVARWIRATVAEALRADPAVAADVPRTQTVFHARVHESLPDWAAEPLPPTLIARLPALPEDVEYRLYDHDLVLWDIHADLIVDVLPDLMPRRQS